MADVARPKPYRCGRILRPDEVDAREAWANDGRWFVAEEVLDLFATLRAVEAERDRLRIVPFPHPGGAHSVPGSPDRSV